MTTSTLQSPADADVAAIVTWKLLALGVSTANEQALAELDVMTKLLAEGPAATAALEELCAAIEVATADEIGEAQQRLFGGQVEVSPYEGSYEDDPFRQARQMSDVAGFYRAFGADQHGPAHERPDHAGCELEFLAYLGARRLAAEEGARPDDASLCAEIEETFLREHAGRWLPAFFRAIEQTASDDFHQALGRFGAAAVRAELDRRRIEPEPVGPRARRLSVEADELECGSGPEPVTPLLHGGRRAKRRTTS